MNSFILKSRKKLDAKCNYHMEEDRSRCNVCLGSTSCCKHAAAAGTVIRLIHVCGDLPVVRRGDRGRRGGGGMRYTCKYHPGREAGLRLDDEYICNECYDSWYDRAGPAERTAVTERTINAIRKNDADLPIRYRVISLIKTVVTCKQEGLPPAEIRRAASTVISQWDDVNVSEKQAIGRLVISAMKEKQA